MYSKKVVLHFPPQLVEKPIIYKLSKDFDLEFNILKADVTPKKEGLLVLGLKGEEKDYAQALQYLKKEGVEIQTLAQDIIWSKEKCTHCGVCLPLCPVSAFEINSETKEVIFNQEKCIACEFCVRICPYNALEVKL